MKWTQIGSAVMALFLAVSSLPSISWGEEAPISSISPISSITPDANLFLDRVDRMFPDAAAVEKQLQFFTTNLLANQQPDGRIDNFPQKVTVNASTNSLVTGNVVSNPGFETGPASMPDSWTPEGTPAFSWVNDLQSSFEGSRMIKMEALTESAGTIRQTLSNPLDVLVDYTTPASVVLKPDSLMILSAYVRTEGLAVSPSGQGVFARISFKDANGADLAAPYMFKPEGGTDDWTEIRGLVTVPSVQPNQIVVEAGVDGAQGTVYWDGIRLMRVDTSISTASGTAGVQVSNKGTAAIPNAGFDAATPVWSGKQWEGPNAVIVPSGVPGVTGSGGQITSSSTDTQASLSMPVSASSNGTRQFGGDYRMFSVKYQTRPGFTSAAGDGKGVAAKITFKDKNNVILGSHIMYGGATGGNWGEISGVFDTPYPVYTLNVDLMLDHAAGTVVFDNAAFIGMDQQASSTEAGFGAVGLFAYVWELTGKSDERLAKQARKAMDFYLHNRIQTVDNPANADKVLVANSGAAYMPYSVSGSTTGADYPTTAFGLHNLASALTYGQDLFTPEQLTEGKAKAYSMWDWLTRVTKFSTQNSQNQALVALLGGIQLAVLYDDTAMKNQIYTYYTQGIPGTNLPDIAFRDKAREVVDGKAIFYEVRGFDVSYAGVSLSDLAEIINEIPEEDADFQGLKQIIHDDGKEMADYFNSRLSADGWIFAGSRHNEGGGSSFNMGNFSGLSYWAQELNSDLGRFLIKGPASAAPSYGDTANLGHIAVHGPVAMHHTLSRYAWVKTEQQKQEDYTFRKGRVSAYFKNGSRQPLTLSVSGTDFTEQLIDTGTRTAAGPKIDRVMGMYFKDGEDRWQYDDVKSSTTNFATPNYDVRKDVGITGTNSNRTRQYYVTNGTVLYNVLAVRFSSEQSYKSLNQLIGLPYMSVSDSPYTPGSIDPGRVRINGIYAADGSPLLDLTADSGAAAAPVMRMGTAKVSGWPMLKAVNAPAGGAAKPTWLSSADLNALSPGFTTTNGKVMDDLYTKALWDPTNVRTSENNGSIVQFANSDQVMVQLTDAPAAMDYHAGDWVCFVVKYAPDTDNDGFTVQSVQAYADRSDVLQSIVIEDQGMKLVIDGENDMFLDKTAQSVRLNGQPGKVDDFIHVTEALGRSVGQDKAQFPYTYDFNGDGAVDIVDLSLLGVYLNKP